MKKIFGIIAASMLIFAGCKDHDHEGVPQANIKVSRTTIDVAWTGGADTFKVKSNVEWAAYSDAVWNKVAPDNSLNDSTEVVANFAITQVNPTAQERISIITVTDGLNTGSVPVRIVQAACPLVTSPASFYVYPEGASNEIKVEGTAAWTATSSQAWCAVSPSSGTGNGIVTVTVGAQTAADRQATVTIKSTDGTITRNITVYQANRIVPIEEIPGTYTVRYVNATNGSVYQYNTAAIVLDVVENGLLVKNAPVPASAFPFPMRATYKDNVMTIVLNQDAGTLEGYDMIYEGVFNTERDGLLQGNVVLTGKLNVSTKTFSFDNAFGISLYRGGNPAGFISNSFTPPGMPGTLTIKKN